MKRGVGLFVSLLCLLATLPAAFGQTGEPDVPPLQVLGPQLVVWSEVQKPKPIPQPSPDRSSTDRSPQPTGNFTGLITVVDGHCLITLANNMVLRLDEEQRTRHYEGRQVKIVGALDESGQLLHVMSIELDS